MIVSLSWLQEYVDITLPPQELADALTMAGLEVEGLTERYAYLDTVVVGRLETVEPHPNADKLTLCAVAAGGDTHKVVCGAPNAKAGMLTALALPGTELPGGMKVEKSVIRGQESGGMLCSEAELGLGEDASGIMDLDSGLAPGDQLAKALNLSDAVIEFGITPNRPDCLSLIGVAREVAAICKTTLKKPVADMPEEGPEVESLTSVDIQDPEACPRYVARVIQGIQIGPSPFWLADRLRSVGQRPINNIVDVTNLVMLETGQPLHAFDFDLLEERRIVVRTANAGEKFTTLDSQEKTLEDNMLLICDGKKPVALAGVMGGLNSEINDATVNVLLESAHFNPMSIRKTSKKLGYHTEASHRFERGTDPEGALFAANRATRLMEKVAGGSVARGVVDAYPLPQGRPTLSVTVKKANTIMGTSLSLQEMADILNSVDLPAKAMGDDALSVDIPSFRVDMSRPEDLVEEVARLWGYDRIPVTSPKVPMESPPPDPTLAFLDRLRNLMSGMGLYEAITYSFVHSNTPDRLLLAGDDPRRNLVFVKNPLTEHQSVMRSSLLPGLLESVARNVNQGTRDLALFELGKIFLGTQGRDLPEEPRVLALAMTGTRGANVWHAKSRPVDFYDLKGAAEAVLERLGIQGARFERLDPAAAPYFQRGQAAALVKNEKQLAVLGELQGKVLDAFDVKQAVFAMEADVAALMDAVPPAVQCAAIPRFPATFRDVTLILDTAVEAEAVLDRVRAMDEPFMESLGVLDVYEGEPIEAGKKSLSFRVTYRSNQATLTDEQVNEVHQKIGAHLVEEFSASLPG